ncbi:hypothetical protein CKM354_001215300 [Cercospora kikuchii]|uniref:C2H2-type domain-containing protein n=1 Tax=Cercospora kikuchii TaxID=84275 RepID=A0A9P3FLF3_9PEZI|nr:uncharacterized protein CKM354_000000200 [Cercospora kikuchii]XP_044663601.1 uncharacterized protein CKM354_001215300 [Cercospora kikuchii]GIZ36530.1 hypothetical protein CKM354_000000200 [Cercospora kikuchii]GIZ49114.1 hypothetical protein CKM354_001215300 [Cercospora kikuchii]
METFIEVFAHLPEYGVVVCKPCGFAIIPHEFAGHLRRAHRQWDREMQQRVHEVFAGLSDVAQAPEEVTYPEAGARPIEWLPVYTDGFRCRGVDAAGQPCPYMCRGAKTAHIAAHCRQAHAWSSNQARGRSRNGRGGPPTDRIWEEGQHCQRFFKFRGWQRYFVVSHAVEAPASDAMRALLGQIQERREELRKESTIPAENARSVADPWLDFTGWSAHLAGFTSEELLATIRPAEGEEGDEDEPVPPAEEDGEMVGLAEACHATRRLIRQAFRVCRPAVVGRAALEHINRRECGADDNERPFYAEQQVKTIRK